MFITLTGGIASGKNFIADLFKAKGGNLFVLDADEVSRIVIRRGEEAFDGVVAYFGTDVLAADGELNRKKLREAIVDNEEARHMLEMVVHPAVFNYATVWYEELIKRDSESVAIYHAPLIIEASLRRLVAETCTDEDSKRKLGGLCDEGYLNINELTTLNEHRYLFNNRRRNKDAMRANLNSIFPYYDYMLLINIDEDIQLERLKGRGYPPYEDGVKLMHAQMKFDERKPFADYIIDNNGTMEETTEQVDNIYNTLIRN